MSFLRQLRAALPWLKKQARLSVSDARVGGDLKRSLASRQDGADAQHLLAHRSLLAQALLSAPASGAMRSAWSQHFTSV